MVAVLDAGMGCTAVLPAPAEMGASLHINGTASSTLDSVFVCRRAVELPVSTPSARESRALLVNDCHRKAATLERVDAHGANGLRLISPQASRSGLRIRSIASTR